MKKQNVLNLIKYHVERNENSFRNEAIAIARYFDSIGDYQLSEYIMGLISESNLYSPQSSDFESEFLKQVEIRNLEALNLPLEITEDIKGIINAVNHNLGINKFLFEGLPGSGKTEAAKNVARLLDRSLFRVDFENLIDSKLGQTNKNIIKVFREINRLPNTNKVVVIFDEIDVIALDRINSNDIREMGRVTSTILRELVAEYYFSSFIKNFKGISKDTRLFKKILKTAKKIPYPGELKNIIKTSLAFSDVGSEYDYLKRLYNSLIGSLDQKDINQLYEEGFTVREIEKLKGESKSAVSRKLKKEEIDSE